MARTDRYALLGWKATKGAKLHGLTLAERDVRIAAAFAQRNANWAAGAK